MTYLRFETPEAKFIVAAVTHGPFSKAIAPQPADAFVVEGTFLNSQDFYGLLNHRCYQKILEHAVKNSAPIFNVDIAPRLTPWQLAKYTVYAHLRLPFELLPFRNASTADFGQLRQQLIKIHGSLRRAIPTNISSIRSAVMAERIMKQVIPAAKKESGEKPTIFFATGMSHLELKEFIEKNNMRRRFLARFAPLESYFRGPQVDHIHWLNPSKYRNLGLTPDAIAAKLPRYRKRSVLKRISSVARLLKRRIRKRA